MSREMVPHYHSSIRPFRSITILSTILLIVTFQLRTTSILYACAFSNTVSNIALLSRIQATQCELLVSIGRIPGTAMPPDWAASGAKLGFSLEVEFTNEQCDYEMTKERLLKADVMMGSNFLSLEPLNEPSFVSAKGRETIKVLPGAYGCQLQGVESQQYALRFFMDFPEGATRNDVDLPAERIYFLSSCWMADEVVLNRARKRKDSLELSIRQITNELEELETIMSNANIFQKAKAFRESILLVERRGKLKLQLEELENKYPLEPGRVVCGPNNVIFAKEGVVAVKRVRGTMGTKEQYHWIGTFIFKEFFEDDDE